MVTRSGQRLGLIAVFSAVLLFAGVSSAAAQSSISFNGGASIDPTQVFGGVAWESPDIAGRFRLRPGIDGGFGDGLQLANINLDVIVKFPLGGSGWTLIQGGGPTITLSKFTALEDPPTELHAGGSYLVAFEHDNGFFTGFRVGGGGFVPQLKIGAGWSVEIK
jgi:hypothetical protein